MKTSAISDRIHIDNNWTAAKDAGICTGNGTYSEPYVIEDIVINGGGEGNCIKIENSSVHFKIENVTTYNSGWGIALWFSSNGEISGNLIYDCTCGILLIGDNEGNKILENIIINNTTGMGIGEMDFGIVSGNIVSNSGYIGLYIASSNNCNISGNIVNNNSYGIKLADCEHNIISENIINYNSEVGLFLEIGTYYNDILKNDISNNHRSIYGNGARYNTIYFNNFKNNQLTPLLYSSSNYWSSTRKIVYTYNGQEFTNYLGNYWDIYTGIDDNNDGIGDTPYYVDKYPLMEPIENYTIIRFSMDGIPGFKLLFLLSILSIAVILISKKVKTNMKKKQF